MNSGGLEDEDEDGEIEDFEITSIHPLDLALTAKSAGSRIWWSIVTIAATIATACLIAVLVLKYCNQDTMVITKLKINREPFPAVTLCNLNPYKKSAITSIPEIVQLIDAYVNASRAIKNTTSTSNNNQVQNNKRKKRQACSCSFTSPVTASTSTSTYVLYPSMSVTWACGFTCCSQNAPAGKTSRLAKVDTVTILDLLTNNNLITNNEAWIGLSGPDTSHCYWYDTASSTNGINFNINTVCSSSCTIGAACGGTSFSAGVTLYVASPMRVFKSEAQTSAFPIICEFYVGSATTLSTAAGTTSKAATTKVVSMVTPTLSTLSSVGSTLSTAYTGSTALSSSTTSTSSTVSTTSLLTTASTATSAFTPLMTTAVSTSTTAFTFTTMAATSTSLTLTSLSNSAATMSATTATAPSSSTLATTVATSFSTSTATVTSSTVVSSVNSEISTSTKSSVASTLSNASVVSTTLPSTTASTDIITLSSNGMPSSERSTSAASSVALTSPITSVMSTTLLPSTFASTSGMPSSSSVSIAAETSTTSSTIQGLSATSVLPTIATSSFMPEGSSAIVNTISTNTMSSTPPDIITTIKVVQPSTLTSTASSSFLTLASQSPVNADTTTIGLSVTAESSISSDVPSSEINTLISRGTTSSSLILNSLTPVLTNMPVITQSTSTQAANPFSQSMTNKYFVSLFQNNFTTAESLTHQGNTISYEPTSSMATVSAGSLPLTLQSEPDATEITIAEPASYTAKTTVAILPTISTSASKKRGTVRHSTSKATQILAGSKTAAINTVMSSTLKSSFLSSARSSDAPVTANSSPLQTGLSISSGNYLTLSSQTISNQITDTPTTNAEQSQNLSRTTANSVSSQAISTAANQGGSAMQSSSNPTENPYPTLACEPHCDTMSPLSHATESDPPMKGISLLDNNVESSSSITDKFLNQITTMVVKSDNEIKAFPTSDKPASASDKPFDNVETLVTVTESKRYTEHSASTTASRKRASVRHSSTRITKFPFASETSSCEPPCNPLTSSTVSLQSSLSTSLVSESKTFATDWSRSSLKSDLDYDSQSKATTSVDYLSEPNNQLTSADEANNDTLSTSDPLYNDYSKTATSLQLSLITFLNYRNITSSLSVDIFPTSTQLSYFSPKPNSIISTNALSNSYTPSQNLFSNGATVESESSGLKPTAASSVASRKRGSVRHDSSRSTKTLVMSSSNAAAVNTTNESKVQNTVLPSKETNYTSTIVNRSISSTPLDLIVSNQATVSESSNSSSRNLTANNDRDQVGLAATSSIALDFSNLDQESNSTLSQPTNISKALSNDFSATVASTNASTQAGSIFTDLNFSKLSDSVARDGFTTLDAILNNTSQSNKTILAALPNFVSLPNGSNNNSADGVAVQTPLAPVQPMTIDQYIKHALKQASSDDNALSATTEDILSYIMASLPRDIAVKAGYAVSDLIMSCKYNGVKCYWSDFKLQLDPNYGNCYTFNALGNFITAKQAGLDKGLSLVYYVGDKEYLDFVQSAGVRIVIHKQNETKFPDSHGFNVASGYKSSTALVQTHTSAMSTPHDPCADSVDDVSTYNYFNASYSIEACLRSCYQKTVISQCQCGDPRVQLPPNSNITYCNVAMRDCVNNFYTVSAGTGNDCNCPRECESVTYDTTLTMTKWTRFQAKNMRNLVVHNGSWSFGDGDKFAKIDIYYEDLIVIEYIEQPAYDVLCVLWDISSIIGLFLGMSVLSLFEVADLTEYLWKKFRA